MDFYKIRLQEKPPAIYADFIVKRSKDLMIRGGSFYAIWDEERGIWSTDEYDVPRLVDEDLSEFAKRSSDDYVVKYLTSFGSQSWERFRKLLRNTSDSFHQLDENLTFANTDVKKTDYISRHLPYSLAPGDYKAWDELVGTLYSVEERAKIEWAIGAVISGDSKKIQKFLVLYGPAGTGKSTILNIIQSLFAGYTASFDAKSLVGNNNTFATEMFKSNPLVAVQHDGDLSRIEDNSKLNSIVAHEEMHINEKFKSGYTAHVNAFLFMGTNQPVKISNAKSGIIRRLIDVNPTGVRLPVNHYHALMAQIEFELGAIAHHCLEVYRQMGKNYYNAYRPLEMMLQTDIFFNFIEAYFDIFKEQDGASLKQAYQLFKEFCAETGIERPLPQYRFREELRNYFDEFHDRQKIDGEVVRSFYSGFNANKFKASKNDAIFSLVMEDDVSLLDEMLKDMPAQGADGDETPLKRWSSVGTKLANIDTTQLHFVKVPLNHIVIDFDLKDELGAKSLEMNLVAASAWPATYAELSKGGSGVHLHYIYDGDPLELASVFSTGIEVKVFTGNASLRRKLTKCNNVPVASFSSGLPVKEKKVLQSTTIQSEKGLRDLIARNMRKEIHPGTKPSVDFIHKILEEAYESGMSYDLTDLRPKIVAFANNSTNQPLQALKVVQKMRFKSEESAPLTDKAKDDRLVFYDVEVFPNLFVVCWKFQGDPNVVRMINPSAQDIEAVLKLRLVGFNNRRYDNHILYARFMGYDNEQLFALSQKIVANNIGSMFGEAYNLSYTDIWDFSSKKQGLKKFEIELGLRHMEIEYPWEEPVAEENWPKVVDYCVNDVLSTEGVFEAREQDFIARQILAELSGLTVNDTTQKHTAKIIFGNDRNPQQSFVYTDLSKDFPGYEFDLGKSTYKKETTGEGGYVYAEPGMYEDVALLDVASMHPTSIQLLNLFGDYTPRFTELKDARMAIKRGDYDEARKMLGGKLKPYLSDPSKAEALAWALKIVINIVYGLTSAKFDNPFRDIRNRDNIVAKRGALFMIDLKEAVQKEGFTVAHIKTDSIKIPNATSEIIKFIIDFGAKYGYDFEHEATYDKFCLVNDAVYVAKKTNCLSNCWIAVGAQFQHPYVFKTLFSHEEVTWDDLCETKEVRQGAMYLDFDVVQQPMHSYKGMIFVGRTGRFVPVTQESGGAVLYRVKDDNRYAVTGTKGRFWMEASMARSLEDKIEIDTDYFEQMADKAVKALDYFGPYETFVK